MKKPRVLCWDLETGYNVVATHSLYNKLPIRHQNILGERYIICGSWKSLGNKTAHSVSLLDDLERFHADPTDDYHVVKVLYEVLQKTDAVIAHFGDKFDMRRFKARAIYHGFDPLPDIIQVDTWKMANKIFDFNNNRLDYLGMYLKVGRKIWTDPDLWMECLQGKRRAVEDMLRYNKQDIHLLEKVYLKLRAWLPTYINHRLFDPRDVCPDCGSTHIQYRGSQYSYTKQRKYRAFQCQSCGSWNRSRKAEPRSNLT